MSSFSSFRPAGLLATLIAASGVAIAEPAVAADRGCSNAISISPEARLVTVAGETLVQFKGHGRLSQPLRIAGVPVDVPSGRSWRVTVPLVKLRRDAAPFARRVAVEGYCTSDNSPPVSAAEQVRLPIGLLGWNTQLASIELGMR